jgi:hypothetical protein
VQAGGRPRLLHHRSGGRAGCGCGCVRVRDGVDSSAGRANGDGRRLSATTIVILVMHEHAPDEIGTRLRSVGMEEILA